MTRTVSHFETITGCELNAFCHTLYHEKPKWVTGSIAYWDTRFLFKTALEAGASVAVEIGTAAGFSSAVLCHALNVASQMGLVRPDFQVVSYDIFPHFYADPTKQVGDAAREQLPEELIQHITFRNPATALNVRQDYADNEIELLFIDADHQHPWPTLDLLATLDSLRPGAVVVLHDINLPILHPQFPNWGVHNLYNDLSLEKELPQDDNPYMPNICSIRIPVNKEKLRTELKRIVFAHEWHDEVGEDYLQKLHIEKPGGVNRRG